jgi:hypothetical protein
MKVILRAQLVTDWGDCTEVDVAEFSRAARALSADTLGLSLADGKALLERLQQTIAGAQADELCELHRVCRSCHRRNPVKDYRLRKIDTVFDTVRLRSARIISCPCEPPFYLAMPDRWSLNVSRQASIRSGQRRFALWVRKPREGIQLSKLKPGFSERYWRNRCIANTRSDMRGM